MAKHDYTSPTLTVKAAIATNLEADLTEVYADTAAAVKKTGNQAVAGIKTFSSSPIIPAPTTDLQAGTKKYTDDLIATEAKAVLTASGDILYASAVNALARLAKGSADQKLFMNAAGLLPEWANGFKVVSYTRNLANAASSLGYTGAGFTPSAAVLIGGVSAGFTGMGIDDGVTHHGVAQYSTTQWFIDSGYSIAAWINATNYQRGRVTVFGTDGCTIQWNKLGTPTGTFSFAILYFR